MMEWYADLTDRYGLPRIDLLKSVAIRQIRAPLT
jgi:hypothetical protein